MKADEKDQKQDLHGLFAPERAREMVDQAMYVERDEPENFIRMLLLLHDHSKDALMSDALMALIVAAYDCSSPHSAALDKYLDSLRAPSARSPEPASVAARVDPTRRGAKASLSPTVDALGGLFDTAREVIERDDPHELRAFKQALAEIREELQAPESSPQPASVADRTHLEQVGKTLADMIEDKRLPKNLRDYLMTAASDTMNDLNEGEEIEVTWMRERFADTWIRAQVKDKPE